MKLKRLNVRLVKLPVEVELLLFHIREGLKNRKLFNVLAQVGFYESHFDSDFSDIVLASVGFDDIDDDLYSWYYELLNRFGKKTEADNEQLTRAALKIYVELMIEKRKRMTD